MPLPDSECARHLERVELMAERAMPRAVAPEVEHLADVANRDRETARDCHRRVRGFLADLGDQYIRAYTSGNHEYYEPARRILLARATLEQGAEARAQIELSLGLIDFARASERYRAGAAYDPGDRLAEARTRDEQALAHFRNALTGPLLPEERYTAAQGQLASLDRMVGNQTGVYTPSFEELACVHDQLGVCFGPRAFTPTLTPDHPRIRQLLSAYATYEKFAYTKNREAEQVYWRLRMCELWIRLDFRDRAQEQLQQLDALDLSPEQRARVAAARLDFALLNWLTDGVDPSLPPLRRAVQAASSAELNSHPRLRWADLLVREATARERRQQAQRSHTFSDFRDCAEQFSHLYNEQQVAAPAVPLPLVHQLGFLEQAIDCYRDAGLAGQMARLAEHMRTQHPTARALPNTMVEVGQTLERMLLFETAREWYEKFLRQFSRHPMAPAARRRLVWISVLLGASVEAQVAELLRGDRDARRFASAIAFRTLRTDRDGAALAFEAYLAKVDARDDSLRTVLAHTYLAQAYFEASCPVATRAGPCVELTREKSLGQAVTREPQTLAQAVRHLEAARAAMKHTGWRDDPFGASFGPPLQIHQREIEEAQAIVELISGDTLAEKALFTRPPYSRELVRTRKWFERRKQQLELMVAAYRKIQTPRFAATVAARQGLIYEADGGLLADVAIDLRREQQAQATALAEDLEEFAYARYEQARSAYNLCLDYVQHWGQDRNNRAGLCRARLGQLLGQYDDPHVYAPDLDDPLLLGPR